MPGSKRVIVIGDSLIRGADRGFCGRQRDIRMVCGLPGDMIEGISDKAQNIYKATGEVPEDRRLTVVVPFKKGGKGKPGNYRSVTLMSVVGMLVEGILRDRIYMYLE
eukprot:g31601.t1